MNNSVYLMFVQMWEMDYEMGIFKKPYFQQLVQAGQLTVADYKKVTGEDYATQPTPTPQA